MKLLTTTLLAVLTLTLCLQARPAAGANILGVTLIGGPSHIIVNMAVMRALAEQGHNVTMVTPLKPKFEHPNIHSVVIPPSEELSKVVEEKINEIAGKKQSMWSSLLQIIDTNNPFMRMQYETLTDPRFTALYDNQSNKFDVIIMEAFMNDFQLAVPAKLKIPVITTWAADLSMMALNHVGNPRDAVYQPAKDFIGRIKNVLFTIMTSVLQKVMYGAAEKHYYELLGSERDSLPTFEEMLQNISLLLVNGHFSEGMIKPNVPAVVEIGGIQIKPTRDALPKDIAEFLNKSSTHGAILFSLGSNVKSEHIKPETNAKLYKVLSKLKQNVIWKWEDLSQTPGNSPNILYKKWLPQDDILAHPNLKLFITHAGKGGIAEAQYHGVPLLALPMFGDQVMNADKLVSDGYGLQTEIHNFDEAVFRTSLQDVLENPKYAQNIKSFSKLYRDRPLTAQQNVVYWTEYVIRHHGAAHMQSPLKQLNFFQAASLDVILFLGLILYVVWRILKFIVVFVCGKLFGKRNHKSKVKKN